MFNKTVVAALFTLVPLVAQAQTERWEWNHMWGGGMVFGWMMWVWIALIVVIAVWAIKFTSERNKADSNLPSEKSALAALKTRLAKGEIDKEEFLAVKKTLES